MPEPYHVVFAVPGIRPYLDPGLQEPLGGAERRAAFFAQGLAQDARFRVTAITYDYGYPPQNIDGVCLIGHPALPKIGYRVQPYQRVMRALNGRRFEPRLPLDLMHMLQRRARYHWRRRQEAQVASFYQNLRADAYLVFALIDLSAEVVRHAHQQKARSIFFAAREGHFDPIYQQPTPDQRDALGYRARHGAYVLHHVDHLFAQTEDQARLARERFQRESLVIRNPIALDRVTIPPESERRDILWVGRDNPIKQPQTFVELARRLPDEPFVMVMTPAQQDASLDRDDLPPNLQLHAYVSPHEIEHFYARARLFISTSQREGMPNTFLEAAKYNVPIVSLQVNPDGMLTQENMGICANGDFEHLVTVVKDLLHDPERRRIMGANAWNYLQREHQLETQVKRLAQALETIILSQSSQD